MKTDTLNFLEALLFNADTPDAETRPLADKSVYDFTPKFTEAVETFVSAFRAHLETTGFPVDKLDESERSFGGNVYWSLSGAGVGFFDDNDPEVCKLHDILKAWAGEHRFEDLAGNLDVGENGDIDLAFIPAAIEIYREKYFGVPKGEATPPVGKVKEVKPLAHTPAPWSIEGGGVLATPVGGGVIETTRIGTGGYGEIELVDGTNEPEGNKYLIASAPELLEALQAFIDCSTPPITWTAQGCMKKARAAIAKATGQGGAL